MGRLRFTGIAALSALFAAGTGALGQERVPIEDFEHGGQAWSFTNGPEFPGAEGGFAADADAGFPGTAGGRLRFDFTGGGAYVQAAVPLPTDPALTAVELMIRKPVANGLTVRIVDETQQTFQKSFNLDTRDWQRVRVRLDTGTFHFGGANDGVFHGAAQSFGLLVEHGGSVRGYVDLDDLVGVPGRGDGGPTMRTPEYSIAEFSARRIDYDFSQAATETVVSDDLSLLGDPRSMRLVFDSDGSGHEVVVTLYSHFQTFERTLGRLDQAGQVVLDVPLQGMVGWSHYGGEDDGIVRLPLRLGTVRIVRVDGKPNQGTVTLRELRVTSEVPTGRALFPLAVSRVSDGRTVFELTVRSLAESPVDATVLATVRGFDGAVVEERSRDLSVPTGAEPVTLTVPASPGEGRYFEAEFSVQAPGQVPVSALATYVPPPEVQASPETGRLDPMSPFGMGLYLYRYPDTPEGLANMDRAAALAEAAGVKWSREEMQWHRIEPRQGEFDFAYYDKLVDTATRHGISVYGLIGYWSDWTEPYTEQGVQDYVRYCRALVSHYKDRIRHWEIWNEPNIFFWSGDKELYFRLLDQAYGAIKEADPEAVVLGCSTAGIDLGFIERAIKAGSRFDGLTVHPYRGDLDDLAFMAELRQTQELVSGRPVWITEMGWPTEVGGGVSEREQAVLIARCYVDAVASGACRSVSWYDFREDGLNPYYNEHHFGIVRHDLTPKPAYLAVATICRQLAGLKPGEVESWDSGAVLCPFSGGGRTVVAAWSHGAAQVATVDDAPEDLAIVNLMGERTRPLRRGDAALVVLQADEPVLIESESGPIRLRPLAQLPSITVRAGETTEVTVRLGEAGSEEPVVRWANPRAWGVERGAQPGAWRISAPPTARPGVHRLSLTIEVAGGRLVIPVPVVVVPDVVEV